MQSFNAYSQDITIDTPTTSEILEQSTYANVQINNNTANCLC